LSGAAPEPEGEAALAARIAERVLPHWPGWEGARLEVVPSGLINRTFLVLAGGRRAVLQRVSPIFPPQIHLNIQAVTDQLARAGLTTPALIPTTAGQLWLELDGQVFRLMSYLDGVCFEKVATPGQAHAAGALVGRFHGALDQLQHDFLHRRTGAHDTTLHLQRLADAAARSSGHRLAGEVTALAAPIAVAAAALPPLPDLPPRVCHGDLKFNNVRFAGVAGAARERAICLIDLDTVGPMSLAHELGDAWRSWCNRNGEDREVAAFDLDLFRAAAEGYRAGLGRALGEQERQAVLLGPEWISLELAARFATDAVEERYFGWDPSRFATRGDHNLVRARGQWSLHTALTATRPERALLLG
jgi:Ser/Thr protein kinase RdoA (MazF antagonist)